MKFSATVAVTFCQGVAQKRAEMSTSAREGTMHCLVFRIPIQSPLRIAPHTRRRCSQRMSVNVKANEQRIVSYVSKKFSFRGNLLEPTLRLFPVASLSVRSLVRDFSPSLETLKH